MKTPKVILSDLARLVGIARADTSSVAAIEAGLIEAREAVSAASRDRDTAEASYQAALLDESAATLARHLERKTEAAIERDRALALVGALESRLATARAAADRDARKAVYEDAHARAEAVKARFPAEYEHHAGAIRDLLADLARAELARERATAEAPDFPAIPPIEDDLRSNAGQPDDIVSSETVRLWCIDGRTDPVPAERQGEVRSTGKGDGTRGILPFNSETNGGQWGCTLRTYRRTRLREFTAGMAIAGLLRDGIALPALHRFGDAYVTPDSFRGLDTALAHLTAERRPDPAIERPIVERLELVPEEPATHETIVPHPKREPDPPVRAQSAREIRAEHTPSRLVGPGRASA